MEKNITVKTNGFTITGRFFSNKVSFRFEVWEVVVDVSGEVYENISKANSALDADLDDKAIAVEAGQLAGMDIWTLADLDNLSDN